MKFDTIIIGGGLSGLTAGITLAEHGQKCLMVSAGQSALHFFAGSFELLAPRAILLLPSQVCRQLILMPNLAPTRWLKWLNW